MKQTYSRPPMMETVCSTFSDETCACGIKCRWKGCVQSQGLSRVRKNHTNRCRLSAQIISIQDSTVNLKVRQTACEAKVQKVRDEESAGFLVYSFYPVVEKSRYPGKERFDYKVWEFRFFFLLLQDCIEKFNYICNYMVSLNKIYIERTSNIG